MFYVTYRNFRAAQHRAAPGALLLSCVVAGWLTLTSSPAWAGANCTGEDGTPLSLNPDYENGDRFEGIRLRGAVRLAPRQVDGLAVHGLSGLAWSTTQRRLIAVSDLGFVLHLVPHFRDGMLIGASYCDAYPLRDEAGKPLHGQWRDAEGLSLRHSADGADIEELRVSFEQQPRVLRFTLDGHWRGALPLPERLRDRHRYQSPNLALESVTDTRRHGVVVAPERPLRDQPDNTIALVSLDGPSFPFQLLDAEHSAVVGLETLPDDDLLVLERRYISPLHPLIIALSRARLLTSHGATVRQTPIARFDTTAGWSMDNFESVAHHRDDLYFMVSDDNASPLQHSLLLYFEVLDDDERAPATVPRPPLSRHRL